MFTERLQKTVGLEKKELEIDERGVRLKLTIVDTPGLNDAINVILRYLYVYREVTEDSRPGEERIGDRRMRRRTETDHS